MLSVQDATDRILSAFAPLGPEVVAIDQALGRVLATPVTARLDHPPQAVSAMDGYAVRSADVQQLPVRLKVVESIAAGTLPLRAIGAGEAARIFTGAALPPGADAIVIRRTPRRTAIMCASSMAVPRSKASISARWATTSPRVSPASRPAGA